MKISIIGTGNVAYHLGKRLLEKGIKINQIIGRNAAHTEGVANILNTVFETDFDKIKTDSDMYIIAVSDSAIDSVAQKLSQTLDNQIVVPHFRFYTIHCIKTLFCALRLVLSTSNLFKREST